MATHHLLQFPTPPPPVPSLEIKEWNQETRKKTSPKSTSVKGLMQTKLSPLVFSPAPTRERPERRGQTFALFAAYPGGKSNTR